jgi:hypothetical protein
MTAPSVDRSAPSSISWVAVETWIARIESRTGEVSVFLFAASGAGILRTTCRAFGEYRSGVAL